MHDLLYAQIMLDVVLAAALVLNPQHSPLIASCGLAVANYAACKRLIPVASPCLAKVGLRGFDKLKPWKRDAIPEALGAVVGSVYILSLALFVPFMFLNYLADDLNVIITIFPHSRLAEYLSGVLSMQSMLVLGIADDIFDLRWRHKFFLPSIAAIPVLLVYYVDFGVTHVALPPFLNIGESIDLGWLYYVYMGAVAIFCTNCINIYAGVNGLEVGQSVVVALGLLANDMLYITRSTAPRAISAHLLSAYILLPFLGCSVALLRENWFPAAVFVGDTYCYFAGMVFAVTGILGHFSKTMLSLFAPQIANFLYSVPQLLHIIPCPRHRMPLVDPATGLLHPSRADVSACRSWVRVILSLLGKLKLIRVYSDGDRMEVSNMTLINLTLVHLGPMREDQLTIVLLTIQGVWTIIALVARHMLARLVFGHDNFP